MMTGLQLRRSGILLVHIAVFMSPATIYAGHIDHIGGYLGERETGGWLGCGGT
jgi:hypothetical protein